METGVLMGTLGLSDGFFIVAHSILFWRFMGTAGTKRLSIDFSQARMIPFLMCERVRPLKGFSNLMT